MAVRGPLPAPSLRPEPLRIVVVAVPTTEALDVVGALDVLTHANNTLRSRGRREPGYAVEIVATRPGLITRWSGFDMVARRAYQDVRGRIDTLILGAADDPDTLTGDARLVAWLRRMAPRTRRIAALCTGSFLLAEAGLLDGRRATTHWTCCGELARRYPRASVDPEPIFVRDRNVYTSAGAAASMDLVLALVEEDFGPRVALAVASNLVLFLKRPGGQAQFSTQLSTQLAERQPLRDLQAWIIEHPGDDLSVPALARRVAMSPRNFFRVFTQQIGITPAQFAQRARVEAARRMLEDTRRSIDEIAAGCGFGSAETMRSGFQRVLGMSPQAYRVRCLESGNGHLPRVTRARAR
ncbi:MAG TPA: helix-turn-helix domain-containing protein [Methylomirabilota bacterium]|nr:helix-turn-helix domain-containing protein [Methylomirabilota bacterium]